MKTVQFGVKCSNYNLMKAFKEECESLRWKYQSSFTEFTPSNVTKYQAMYFTDDWHGSPFGFSLTNLGGHRIFELPKDWDAAVQFAKEAIEKKRKLELNSRYTAEIDIESKTVTVGCQTFTFDKINELAGLINS